MLWTEKTRQGKSRSFPFAIFEAWRKRITGFLFSTEQLYSKVAYSICLNFSNSIVLTYPCVMANKVLNAFLCWKDYRLQKKFIWSSQSVERQTYLVALSKLLLVWVSVKKGNSLPNVSALMDAIKENIAVDGWILQKELLKLVSKAILTWVNLFLSAFVSDPGEHCNDLSFLIFEAFSRIFSLNITSKIFFDYEYFWLKVKLCWKCFIIFEILYFFKGSYLLSTKIERDCFPICSLDF